MSFYKSQAVLFALQALYSFVTYAFGVCVSTDEKRSALNRTIVVLQIVVYWCCPVLIAALFPSRYVRGLSDEEGVKLLEELSLWLIVGDVLVRPFVQFVKALSCVILITRATQRRVRAKSFASHLVRDMVEGDREGLLNLGWLTSWRILKDLREEVKLNAHVPLIIIGAMEFWLAGDSNGGDSNQSIIDLTWMYDDEDKPPVEETLCESPC